MSEASAPKRATPEQVRRAWQRVKLQKWRGQTYRHRRLLQLLAALTAVAAFQLLPIPTEVFALLAMTIFVAFLFGAALEHAISIRPFDLPKEMEQHGWNGEIAARHFGDALLRIDTGARFGQQAFPLHPEQPLPDIEVPRTGVKAANLVDVFRFLVGRPRLDVTAEIIGCSGAYRLHGRLNGVACFDVTVSGPDGLSDALQAAAGDLTRAVALPVYLFFLLPQRSRALSVAREVVDRAESSVADQVFAAKFATWLTLVGIAESDIGEVPGRVADAKRLAAQALKLSPNDGEAEVLVDWLEALPRLDFASSLEHVSEGLQMLEKWGVGFFRQLAETSPMFRALFFEATETVRNRLLFISALDNLQKEIEKVRNDLKNQLKLLHQNGARIEELRLFGVLENSASMLRVPARFTKFFKETGTVPPIHETDKVALVKELRLLKRTVASVEHQTSRLLSTGQLKTLEDSGIPTDSRESGERIRAWLTEVRQDLVEWSL